jgi:hypothetical protein
MRVILSVHSKSLEHLDNHPKQRASVRRLAGPSQLQARKARDGSVYTKRREISVGKLTYWIRERASSSSLTITADIVRDNKTSFIRPIREIKMYDDHR